MGFDYFERVKGRHVISKDFQTMIPSTPSRDASPSNRNTDSEIHGAESAATHGPDGSMKQVSMEPPYNQVNFGETYIV